MESCPSVITSYGKSDVGFKRSHNEDAFVTGGDNNLAVVADGMGGAAAGEVKLLVSHGELQRRRKAGLTRPDHPAPGMLAAYRQMVGSADKGAVWL